MINVTIAGRLGKDAEIRQTNGNSVCSFSVAADVGLVTTSKATGLIAQCGVNAVKQSRLT